MCKQKSLDDGREAERVSAIPCSRRSNVDLCKELNGTDGVYDEAIALSA